MNGIIEKRCDTLLIGQKKETINNCANNSGNECVYFHAVKSSSRKNY